MKLLTCSSPFALDSRGREMHPRCTDTLTGAAKLHRQPRGGEMMPPRLWLPRKARSAGWAGFEVSAGAAVPSRQIPRTAAAVPGSEARGRIFLPEPRVPLGNPVLPVICLGHLFPLVLRKSQNAGPDTGTEPAASAFLQGWTWTLAIAR